MTVYIVYSDTVGFDGELKSASTSHANARNGTGTFTTVATADGWGIVGQQLVSGTYTCSEMFFQFNLAAIPSTDLMVSAFFNFFNKGTSGSAARDIEVREYDFGASLTNADWRTPAQFSALPYYGDIRNAHQAASGVTGLRGGSEALKTRIATGSDTLRVVAATSRFRLTNAPTTANSLEYNSVYHSSQAGTAQDPMLMVETIKQHSLVHVGGQGAIQLSNGNHFYLEFNGSTVSPAIVGKYHNGTSASIIVTLSLVQSFDADYYALQRYAICTDDEDNIYIFGQNGDDENNLSAKCLVKNAGVFTWAEKQTISFPLPAYFTATASVINNITAVWHPTQGQGNIIVFVAHQAWTDDTNMISYAITSCAAMQAGSGSLVTKSGSVEEFIDLKNNTELIAYPNETGTGMDCAARGSYPGAHSKGNFFTYDSDGLARYASYQLTGPTTLVNGFGVAFNSPIVKEPNSKLRMVPIDFNRYIAIAGDFMMVVLWDGGILSTDSLTGAGLASTPTSDQFTSTTNWDCVYDPAANMLYVYYLDFADSNRLMRTSYDCASYLWTGEEKEVDAAIGAGGSTNHSVRCPRQWIRGRRVQVAISNVAAGVHTTVYNYDSINVAPSQPTLNTKSPFDSDLDTTFTWVFNDRNANDGQSAFQLQVIDDTATVVYDTGKVTSTISSRVMPGGTILNNDDFQWRVRTYDLDDTASSYSQYSAFSTSNAAIVTITFPVTDNPADYQSSDVPLQWSVSGAPQDQYRVKVVRTYDSATFSDTGFITSTQGVRTVTGLASGIEYRFEVTVKSAGVDSNTATRLLTPDYATPEVPTITVTPMDADGYVLINVVNPEPDGDRPNAATNVIVRVSDKDGSEDIAYVASNGTYRDYTARARTSYTYFARARSADGYQAQSLGVVTVLRFNGVYIHNPEEPQESARGFLYGKDQRSHSITPSQTAQKYAGRKFPVMRFGIMQEDQWSIRVDVGNGVDYNVNLDALEDFVDLRKTLCFRDNRGRKWFGTIDALKIDDAAYGAQASWNVNRVEYSEEVE